jgi:molybdopterin/thiamine biosynthesis adenylyltransferase
MFFFLTKEEDQDAMQKLFNEGSIRFIGDDYEEQLRELFSINNPLHVYEPGLEDSFQEYIETLQGIAPLWQQGFWVFYPWLAKVVHILSEADFRKVRTARNMNLITKEEQDRFYHASIGIGGLSVGNSIALAIVLQGGGGHIKLADMDRLALSNTNRVPAGVNDLGLRKVDVTARRIYELNPYAVVEVFPDGLTKENLNEFFQGEHPLDIIIDELDNLGVKYLIRECAKQYRVPLVMAADNGDNGVIDVERYDLDPQPEFFHGRIGTTSYEELHSLDKFGIGRTITKHIGPENVTPRMQASLLEMGKTIVSWPQLGGAALLNGAAVAYCVRRILNDQPIVNNRGLLSVDAILDPAYMSEESQRTRSEATASFREIFHL